MKGDFSSWRKELGWNFNGVLQQQGRVLLDSDWNAQTRLANHWQETAGRDIIGAGVAAVPADSPLGFLVESARLVTISPGPGPFVELTLRAGRLWADGWLVRLAADPGREDTTRVAGYLDDAIALSPPVTASPPDAPVRDAVILELWREELNGYQRPDLLIEPALGGPDTTERVHTAMAFRLLRLGEGETCDSVLDRLRDDFSGKGRLTVSLDPPGSGEGDCPMAAGGGYTGFEHNLYRIEIAEVNAGLGPLFKWSQFNGGLVGRGEFDAVGQVLRITANAPAITASGLNRFYLEALRDDPAPEGNLGHWRLTYGAVVTLDDDGFIHLPPSGSAEEYFGAIPVAAASPPESDETVFFRLWNDIRPVADFTAETRLQDGLRLRFDSSDAAAYRPWDYWTFPVRADGVANENPLVDGRPPDGVHYRRVPLAILQWQLPEIRFDLGDIHDCRHRFPPLTRLSTCCTYRVGDGIHSHGDFDRIQDAIDHLPAEGGEVCVLPGIYAENVRIVGRRNLVLRGCGPRSRIQATGLVSPETGEGDTDPTIFVLESQDIRIESLAVAADETGCGILLEGPPVGAAGVTDDQFLRHVTVREVEVEAGARSAIRAHVGYFVTLRDCRITVADRESAWAAIYFVGEDGLIENNEIRVVSARESAAGAATNLPASGFAARGGLHLGGGSERVRIAGNLIQGGTGHGITLGSVDQAEGENFFAVLFQPWQLVFFTVFDFCRPWPVLIPGVTLVSPEAPQAIAGAPLSEIRIEGNRIHDMGGNGIGVDAFFDLSETDEFITVQGLAILGNDIRRCLNRTPEAVPENLVNFMGHGGIVLADAEDLVIRDNVIEDNGPDYQEPVCGIFVLHAEGLDISRNRIVNNGARPAKSVRKFKPGRRGGINIVYGIAPQQQISRQLVEKQTFRIPFANGVPAVRIHDNIVSTPLGQALSLAALGPVSVIGNQFTTLDIVPGTDSPTFIAATVGILNLGLSNELWFQLLGFMALRQGQVQASKDLARTPDADGNISLAGLDDFALGRYLANGNVLFTNNQCRLNLMEPGFSAALTSVLILSLDDIGFHHNQCDADLLDDFILTQAFLFGASLRVTDNRFKESLPTASLYAKSEVSYRPTISALFSAVTLGFLNITTDNESTRCLLIRGGLVLNKHNLVLLDLLMGNTGNVDELEQSICGYAGRFVGNFGKAALVRAPS